MGSLLKPKAAQTPIPQQAAFETQIDNLAGTKVERVKQPDGSYAIVRSSLDLSPEDQAYQNELTALRESALSRLTKLSTDFNLDDLPELKQYVDDYRTTNLQAIDAAANTAATQQERLLSRFGQADSTAATEERTGLLGQVIGQKAQLGRDLSGIVLKGRDSEIGRVGSLYNLATGGLSDQKNTQLQSLSTSLSSGYQGQQINQGYNDRVAATIGANNQARTAASQAGLSNLAGLVALGAAPFTGGASLLAYGGLKGYQSYGNR